MFLQVIMQVLLCGGERGRGERDGRKRRGGERGGRDERKGGRGREGEVERGDGEEIRQRNKMKEEETCRGGQGWGGGGEEKRMDR